MYREDGWLTWDAAEFGWWGETLSLRVGGPVWSITTLNTLVGGELFGPACWFAFEEVS